MADILNYDYLDKSGIIIHNDSVAKMLQTFKEDIMKKKLLLVLAAMLMFSLVACGDKKEKDETKDDKKEDTTVSTVAKEDEEDTTEEVTEEATEEEMTTVSGVYYLFNSTDWGEEKDLTGLNLFGDKLTLPITLDDINANCAPFVYDDEYGYETFYRENAASLDDIHALDYVFDSSTSMMYALLQSSWDPDTNWTDYHDEWQCWANYLYIGDMKETGMTVAEAMDGGYWYLQRDDKFEYALGTSEENVKGMKAEEIYAYIAENFGKPSYVYFSKELDYEANMKALTTNDNGSFYYYLVYEREDYVITMGIFEMINDGKNYYPTFGTLCYFTPTQWEDYKAVEDIGDDNILWLD